jgi:hypothetical protein
MDVGEAVNGRIEFSQWLIAGETIASVSSMTAANYVMLTGSPTGVPSMCRSARSS